MVVNFYLPGIHLKIIGGYKVVYQYANYLAEKGNKVNIYYDEYFGKNGKHIPKKVSLLLKKIIILMGYPRWFKLNKRIRQYAVKEFCNDIIEDADISVATSYETAKPVSKLSCSKGEKFYFIQHFEDWSTSKENLYSSYRLGMNNIVISKWLKKIVDEASNKNNKLILNGLDLKTFCRNTKISKKKYTIAMMYSDDPMKGSIYGLKAIDVLIKKYKNLEIVLYGNPKRPPELLKSIKYYRRASEESVSKILNEASIFLCTSISEGFGLPGLEAMGCECALVTSDCIGALEYANNSNSIIYKPKDIDAIVESISKLLDNDNYRESIAKEGFRCISNAFDLRKSQKEFYEYISRNHKKEKI